MLQISHNFAVAATVLGDILCFEKFEKWKVKTLSTFPS